MYNNFDEQSNEPLLISLEGQWKFKEGEYIEGEEITDLVILPGTMDTNRKGKLEKGFSTDKGTTTLGYNVFIGTNPEKNEQTERLSRIYTYSGKAVYQRTVSIPSNWIGKSVSLI